MLTNSFASARFACQKFSPQLASLAKSVRLSSLRSPKPFAESSLPPPKVFASARCARPNCSPQLASLTKIVRLSSLRSQKPFAESSLRSPKSFAESSLRSQIFFAVAHMCARCVGKFHHWYLFESCLFVTFEYVGK